MIGTILAVIEIGFIILAVVIGLAWASHSDDGENCPTCQR